MPRAKRQHITAPERALTPVEFKFSADKIADLPMSDLLLIYDGLRGASTALLGIINQPRAVGSINELGSTEYTAGGDEVERMLDFMGECIELLIKTAKQADFDEADARNAEQRAWLLLKYEAEQQDVLHNFAALAARLSSEHETAKCHQRHAQTLEAM